jgi:hypothetical protein
MIGVSELYIELDDEFHPALYIQQTKNWLLDGWLYSTTEICL